MQYQFAFGEMIHLSVIEDSIEFTIRQYVHTNDEELKKAIALLNDSDDIIEAKSVKDFMLCSSC